MGPWRSPIRPASTFGSQCTPMIRPRRPALRTRWRRAHPGQDLFGGLENEPYGMRQEPLAMQLGEDEPAPRTTVVCTSWPQACARPGTVER